MDVGINALPDLSGRRAALLDAIEAAAPQIAGLAAQRDQDSAFPTDELQQLRERGALSAPLPCALGGLGCGTEAAAAPTTLALLRIIGRASLPLGRVFEGHVNALRLVCLLGTPAQTARAAADAHAGHLFGIWNTDPAEGAPGLTDRGLAGAKILASGAGHVTRALITDAAARRQLLLVRLAPGQGADLSGWTAQGMRASATGRVTFDGIGADAVELIGGPAEYLAQPDFSAGAWRVLAVQLGGLDAIIAELRGNLVRRGRAANPHQLARVGAALIAQDSAAGFVCRASSLAEAEQRDTDAVVAYVGLARAAVEAACLEAMQLAQRSLGLAAFMRPAPIERICRDLATYLRQPAPDDTLTEAAAYFMVHDLP